MGFYRIVLVNTGDKRGFVSKAKVVDWSRDVARVVVWRNCARSREAPKKCENVETEDVQELKSSKYRRNAELSKVYSAYSAVHRESKWGTVV